MADIPTRDEVRDALAAAMTVALAITRSKQRAEDFVQEAFESVLSGARPWLRDKGPFDRHLMGAVRSIVSHSRTSAQPKKDVEAQEGFHREVVGHSAPSPEDKTLHRAEEEGRQSTADSELDDLDASVADNPAARSVLRCRRAHDEPLKAGEIAKKLGLPVEQIYRANELLKEHLAKIRARKKDPEE